MTLEDSELSMTTSLDLRVSPYERVASSLIAALLFVGFLVMIMLLVWLTRRAITSQKAVPVELIEEVTGGGNTAQGFARELEEPGLEEIDQEIEPALQEAVASLDDIVLSEAAALESLSGNATTSGHGQGAGHQNQAGAGGEGRNIIPRWNRWEIRFTSSSQTVYARQLDFFKIELGAAGGGRKAVDYASGFSQGGSRTRRGSGDKEDRLYMTWRSGVLRDSDLNLLKKAGIPTAGRVVMQFYPPDLENRMALLERDASGGRLVEEIQKTVFSVVTSKDGYAFKVVNQTFRNVP